jgi:DNA primase
VTEAIDNRLRQKAVGPTIAGIRISHPDRVIYSDLGVAKLHLARYFDDIGDWILPHVRGRPLTLVHCPAGLAGPCRFLKHAKARGAYGIASCAIREKCSQRSSRDRPFAVPRTADERSARNRTAFSGAG